MSTDKSAIRVSVWVGYGREVLAHQRVSAVPESRWTDAGVEHRAALVGDTDVVAMTLCLVRHFIHVRFSAANAYTFAL